MCLNLNVSENALFVVPYIPGHLQLLTELWQRKFSPCSDEQHLCSSFTLPELISRAIFHFPCIFFFIPSSRRSLLSKANFLPYLHIFQHLEITCFCALNRWCLKADLVTMTEAATSCHFSYKIVSVYKQEI